MKMVNKINLFMWDKKDSFAKQFSQFRNFRALFCHFGTQHGMAFARRIFINLRTCGG
jgi:hypothetical protein